MSLRSLNLLYQTKSLLPIESCTKEEKYKLLPQRLPPTTRGAPKAFLKLPEKMPVALSLPKSHAQHLKDLKTPSSGKKLLKLGARTKGN